MSFAFYTHVGKRWEADMERIVQTTKNKPIDENVLEFLILLIEADMELQDSSMGDKEN